MLRFLLSSFCPGSEEIPLVFSCYAFLCQGFLIKFLPHLTQLHLSYVWCFCALTCVGNCLESILENTQCKERSNYVVREGRLQRKGQLRGGSGAGWLHVEDGAIQAEGTPPREGTEASGTQAALT